jgi:hypothetical protein
LDVVYPYRRGGDEFELRYSLRSLVNVAHDRVIVAGDRPLFASDALVTVPGPRRWNRYRSSTANILAAVRTGGITGRFVVMNDDFFVLRPWTPRVEHRGTIAEYLASGRAGGEYQGMVERTRDLLQINGVADPFFFGLHTPMVYDAARLLGMVELFRGERYLLRTLYGNLHAKSERSREDVKVRVWPAPIASDLLSTCDRSSRDPDFRAWINARFPAPSIYEDRDNR